MKKRNANDLYEAIDNALTPIHENWTIDPPRHTKSGRKVNYYLILSYNVPEGANHPPIIPSTVHSVLKRHGLTTRNLTQRTVQNVTESDSDAEYKICRTYGDKPRYEVIIDTSSYEVLPKTGEEKRQEELAEDIRRAIALPRSGYDTAENLAAHFESVEEVLTASDDEIDGINGVGNATKEAIKNHQSPALRSRLKNHQGDVLIVRQNEQGTYEPVYKPPDADTYNSRLIRQL